MGGGGKDREVPLLPVAGSTKMPGLNRVSANRFPILVYFLITIIISIHLSKSFIIFHNFFRSRSKWYWSTSEEIRDIRSRLRELLNQPKAENFSQTGAFCFMVTNRSELEMDKCEARHHYICGEYRGTLKKDGY